MRRFVFVANTDAATNVDMPQRNAPRAQTVHELTKARGGCGERRGVVEERADVAADADDLELAFFRRVAVEALRFDVGDAKFGLAQARRDIGVRAGVNVRIDAQCDRRPRAEATRDARHALELGSRFHVDATDAARQRELDLRFALTDPREQSLGSVAAGGEHSRELTAGHDVEARAQPREQRKDRKVGIRLD